MIFKVCVTRDSAANCFSQPFFVPALGVAVRSFGDEVKRVDPNNQLNKHPEDFELFCIGEYDDATATFTAKPAESIARGVDYVQVQ